MIDTEQYIRKPLYVNALRVTEENFDASAAWCEGTVETESAGPREGQKFIKVSVHGIPKSQRQTKAFVGDWLLHTERGFKVYTDNAFRASFNAVAERGAGPVVKDGVEATLERAPAITGETPTPSDSDSAPPPQAPNGQRIITLAEQNEMDPDEVTELLRSGQAILEQDVAA